MQEGMNTLKVLEKLIGKNKTNKKVAQLLDEMEITPGEKKRVLYQIIEDFQNERGNIEDLYSSVSSNHEYLWNHSTYNSVRNRLKEQDDFIRDPFEVEEGVLQCNACGSRRVFSVTTQERSCDEGYSLRAQCANCKQRWTHRG